MRHGGRQSNALKGSMKTAATWSPLSEALRHSSEIANKHSGNCILSEKLTACPGVILILCCFVLLFSAVRFMLSLPFALCSRIFFFFFFSVILALGEKTAGLCAARAFVGLFFCTRSFAFF